LQETLGTTEAEMVRAPFGARVAAWMREWLDALVTPQLATVATMLLLAVLVGTSTLSPDGSIGGMYNASLRLAAQTYNYGATHADEFKRVTTELVGSQPSQQQGAGGSKSQQGQGGTQQPEQKNR
ncbi:MAG TPA: hypothetical protein VF754_07870, partial [Pyrinomonadaceae bacterium]